MGPGTHAYTGVICTCTCNTIICKITHDTGSESTVAQMVRLQFGLELKFKPWSEFSLCTSQWEAPHPHTRGIAGHYAGNRTTLDAIFYDRGTTRGASAGIRLRWTGKFY